MSIDQRFVSACCSQREAAPLTPRSLAVFDALRFWFRSPRVSTRSQLKKRRMFAGTQRAAPPRMGRCGRPPPLLLLGLLLRLCSAVTDDRLISDRYAVYWNSSNPR